MRELIVRHHTTVRGFTLIELLVVISIIGLLASVVLTSVASAQSSALDTRIRMEIRQLQQALEMYRADNGGVYPCSVVAGESANVSNMTSGCRDLTPYMGILPTNPHGWSDGEYRYQPGNGNNRTTYTIIYQLHENLPVSNGWCHFTEGSGFSGWVAVYPEC